MNCCFISKELWCFAQSHLKLSDTPLLIEDNDTSTDGSYEESTKSESTLLDIIHYMKLRAGYCQSVLCLPLPVVGWAP